MWSGQCNQEKMKWHVNVSWKILKATLMTKNKTGEENEIISAGKFENSHYR